jgi:hypothetical protein
MFEVLITLEPGSQDMYTGECPKCKKTLQVHIDNLTNGYLYVKCGESRSGSNHHRAIEENADYAAVIQSPLTILAKRFK